MTRRIGLLMADYILWLKDVVSLRAKCIIDMEDISKSQDREVVLGIVYD